MADLATKIIEEQEDTSMKKLTLKGHPCKSKDELSQEEKQLINAIVRSGFNQLTDLSLYGNPSWFLHKDAWSYLFELIQEQTCLKELNLTNNYLSSETTGLLFSCLLQSECLNTIEKLDL